MGFGARRARRLLGWNPDLIEEDRIPFVVGNEVFLIAQADIHWVQAAGDYVRLHTIGDSFLFRISLTELLKRWKKHGFVRIHRKYIVRLSSVGSIKKGRSYHVVVGPHPDAIELPLSRRNERDFLQLWVQYSATKSKAAEPGHHDGMQASRKAR